MKKLIVIAGVAIGWLLASIPVSAEDAPQKVLFINSYHAGYPWSDGIEKGLEETLSIAPVELKKFYMDTKQQRDPQHIKSIAKEAKLLIDEYKPDVVITADDNAAKHVIKPFFSDSKLPFVFCGVNWDASVYGFPFENVTGMEEVSLIKSIRDRLREYAKGNKIGLISINAISGRRNVEHFERNLGAPFDKIAYVDTFEQWKTEFSSLQASVDMLIFENPKGISGWDHEKGLEYVEQNTKIPVGTTHVWLAPYALITIAKIPEEQGIWAAQAALKILKGKKPSEIPIVKNKRGNLFVNIKIAQKMGVVFKPDLIETAKILR